MKTLQKQNTTTLHRLPGRTDLSQECIDCSDWLTFAAVANVVDAN